MSTGSLQQFLHVTQDHLWCLFAISSLLVLLPAIFPVHLEIGRNASASFWWSSVGQQINVIDVDNVGGPPGSPDGFVEVKQFFLPKHIFSGNRPLAVSSSGYARFWLLQTEKEGRIPSWFFSFSFNLLSTGRKEKNYTSCVSQAGRFQRKSLFNKRVLELCLYLNMGRGKGTERGNPLCVCQNLLPNFFFV